MQMKNDEKFNVSVAEELCNRLKFDQVIIIGRRCRGDDAGEVMITAGKDDMMSDSAAFIGQHLAHTAMNWPSDGSLEEKRLVKFGEFLTFIDELIKNNNLSLSSEYPQLRNEVFIADLAFDLEAHFGFKLTDKERDDLLTTEDDLKTAIVKLVYAHGAREKIFNEDR